MVLPSNVEKKSNAGEKLIPKNQKKQVQATDSPISPEKTTKKAISKQIDPKCYVSKVSKVSKQLSKFKKKTNPADVPAFLPKYEEYRLADIVSTTKWREDNVASHVETYIENYIYKRDGTLGIVTELDETAKESLQDYIFRLFPNSIACQYLKKTKRTDDMNVLSSIVDQFVTSHNLPMPSKDTMVMHLRVGDVIDGTDVPVDDFFHRRINSYYALFGVEAEGWSPVYVRCLASFDRALKKTKELGFHKISFIYGFHIKGYSIKKSKKYLAGLADYAHSEGFEVEFITHADADVSFAYACNAAHFIPGGGGFSKLMSKVVRHKGNSVYYVRV